MEPMKLKDIAQYIDGEVCGDGDVTIHGLSPLEDIQENHLVIAKDKYLLALAEASKAAAVLIPNDLEPQSLPAIKVKNIGLTMAGILNFLEKKPKFKAHIAETAVIAKSAKLGQNISIGAHAVIGEDVTIADGCIIHPHVVIGDKASLGKECVLHPHVTLYAKTILKDKVTIHANTVIGADGFGYVFDGEKHVKLAHLGHVIIEEDVEIGANTTIDRATIGTTTIGKGTKIDNLVQVAHNVKLGNNNILCAFAGIAGSSTTGNQVIMAPNAGLSDHVTVKDNVIIGPRAGVPQQKTLPENTTWLGNPARPRDKAIEQVMATQLLPSLRKTVKKLQQQVKDLQKQIEKEETTS